MWQFVMKHTFTFRTSFDLIICAYCQIRIFFSFKKNLMFLMILLIFFCGFPKVVLILAGGIRIAEFFFFLLKHSPKRFFSSHSNRWLEVEYLLIVPGHFFCGFYFLGFFFCVSYWSIRFFFVRRCGFIFIHVHTHVAKKSFNNVIRSFSAISIWFSRSARSVVSARSNFHDKFSISLSRRA